MKTLLKILRDFLHECAGPTAVEYAVLLVLIIFGAMASISLLGATLSNSVGSTARALPSGASGEDSGESSQDEKDKKDKKDKKDNERNKKGRRGRGGRASTLSVTSSSLVRHA